MPLENLGTEDGGEFFDEGDAEFLQRGGARPEAGDIEQRIVALSNQPTDEELNSIVADIHRLSGNPIARNRLSAALAAKAGMTKSKMDKAIEEIGKAAKSKTKTKAKDEAPSKVAVFKYYGDYHTDEGKSWVRSRILDLNADETKPTLSYAANRCNLLQEGPLGASFKTLTSSDFTSQQRELMAFQRDTDAGAGKREAIPFDICQDNYNMAYDYLPETPLIVRAPVLISKTEKGSHPVYSVLSKDRHWYDPHGVNIYSSHAPLVIAPVPTDPSDELIADATTFFENDVLGDFIFSDLKDGARYPHASFANAVAMVLTPFAMPAIRGRTPMFAIQKPDAGAGSSLLARLPGMLIDGFEPDSISFSEYDDKENMNNLVIAAEDGRSCMFYDNVKRTFYSTNILTALTSSRFGGRKLGYSQQVTRDNNVLWVLTGINTVFGEEMARRSALISLNPLEPLSSRTFRHQDYGGFILEHRAEIIRCILIFLNAWIARGASHWAGKGLKGVEGWSNVVGGIMDIPWPGHQLVSIPVKVSIVSDDAVKQDIARFLIQRTSSDLSISAAIADAIAADEYWIEGHDLNKKVSRARDRFYSIKNKPFLFGSQRYIFDISEDGASYKFMSIA